MSVLKVKFLSDSATTPKRSNVTDAGLDLCAAEDVIIMLKIELWLRPIWL